MSRTIPSSSRGERRSSQFTPPGQAVPSPTAVSSHPRLAGLIVQFPSRDELEKPPGVNLHLCYGHPCVILSPVAVDGVVTVLPMTSFGDRPIQVKHPNSATKRAHYLPVAPAPAHPDTAALLHLADPARMAMNKNSYVNTKRPYPGIPLDVLRPFRGPHGHAMVLDAASYQLVLERSGFAPPPPPPPPRQNPSRVPLLDHGDCSIDVDQLRPSRPLHRPPPSYATVSVSRPPRRAPPVRSPTPGAAGVVVQCVLWASVLVLVGYGGYLGVVKTVAGVRLFWAWGRNGVGAVADAVRGAWEAVAGWVRRAVGFLPF